MITRCSVATLALFAACSSAPIAPAPRQDPLASFRADEFPGADALLRGFATAAADDDRGWRTGDQVLFGLRLRSDDQTRRWLLRLTVLDTELFATKGGGTKAGAPEPRSQHRTFDVHGHEVVELTSRLAAVHVEVADDRGQPLGESRIEMPRDLLDIGFTAACKTMESPANRRLHRNIDALYAADVRPYVEAMGALLALLDVVNEDPTLSPILWQVVAKPSLWSVLWHFGASVSVQPRFHDAVRAVPLPAPFAAGDAAWVVPITLSVNNAPALFCDVVVGSAARPFALCGGIVGAEARHPTDATLRFSFRLLAAQRAAR